MAVNRALLTSSVLTLSLFSFTAAGSASFQGLGFLPDGTSSVATGVSADGSVVVGGGRGEPYNSRGAFIWTLGQGLEEIKYTCEYTDSGRTGAYATAVSADGLYVVGPLNSICIEGPWDVAYKWSVAENTFERYDYLGVASISGNGDRVVGDEYINDEDYVYSFVNVAEDGSYPSRVPVNPLPRGISDIPFRDYFPAGEASYYDILNAGDISFDGDVVVGSVSTTLYAARSGDERLDGTSIPMLNGFRSNSATGQREILLDLPGGEYFTSVEAVSGDSTVVVGQGSSSAGDEAFRWTLHDGITGLGDLAGGEFDSVARDASEQGYVVVGWGTTAIGQEAFVWDPVNGMRNLKHVLVNQEGLNLSGWILTSARAVSTDGRIIVGTGTNPAGETEAWRAELSMGTIPNLPVLAPIDGQTVAEGETLTFIVSASDRDGTIPGLTADLSVLLPGASFTDNGDGTGTFSWMPAVGDAGSYPGVLFTAGNTQGRHSESITITVTHSPLSTGDVELPQVVTTTNFAPVGGKVKQWSHPYDPAISDRVLVVLQWEAVPDRTLDSLTYNGTAMSRLVEAGVNSIYTRHVEIWELKQDELPQQAGNYTIRAQYSRWVKGGGGAFSISNTSQSNPVVSVSKTQNANEGQLIFSSFYLPTKDMLVIGAAVASNTGSYTELRGWEEHWDNAGSPNTAAFSKQVGEVTSTSVQAFLDGPARDQAIVAVAFEPRQSTRPPVIPVLQRLGSGYMVLEGQPLHFTIGYDPALNKRMEYSADLNGLPSGASFMDNGDGSGTFSWTPQVGDAGHYPSVVFRASNGQLSDNKRITIRVIEQSLSITSPVLLAENGGYFNANEGESVSYTMEFFDLDGQVPVFVPEEHEFPANAVFTDNGDGTGTFNWVAVSTSPENEYGHENLYLAFSNGDRTFKKYLRISVNQVPVLSPIGDQNVVEGDTLSFTVTASDVGDYAAQRLRFSIDLSSLPNGASFVDNRDGTGTFTWTPARGDAGIYPGLVFKVTDNYDASDTETIKVTVTAQPGGHTEPPQVVMITSFSPVGGRIKQWNHAYDPATSDRVLVILQWEGKPERRPVSVTYHGVAMEHLVESPGLNLNYTRHAEIWQLKRSQLPSNAGSYLVLVNYNGWVMGGGGSVSLSDTEQSQAVSVVSHAQSGAAGKIVSKSIVLPVDNMLVIAATTAANRGSYSAGSGWVERWDHNGSPNSAVFSQSGMSASDLHMAFSLDGSSREQELVAVAFKPSGTQGPTNRAPVLAPISNQNVTEGESLSFSLSATDADGTTPTLSADLSALPSGASLTDHHNGSGTFTWMPSVGQSGTYPNVVFSASDGQASHSQSITIMVNSSVQNAPPVQAVIGSQSVIEGETLRFTVEANDADGTIPSMSANLSGLPAGADYADNQNGTGTFTWTPAIGEAGTYGNIEFSASDGIASDSESILITVMPIQGGESTPASVVSSTSYSPKGGVTRQWLHTFDPATSDRVLVVLHWEGKTERRLQSLTFDGIAMIRLAEASVHPTYTRHTEIWELKKVQLPQSAGHYQIRAQYSAWVMGGGGAYSLSHTDQSQAVVVKTVAQRGGAGKTISANIVLPEDNMLVIAAATASNSGTYQAGNGWTEDWDVASGSPNMAAYHQQVEHAGAQSIALTLDGRQKDQAMVVIAIPPAP